MPVSDGSGVVVVLLHCGAVAGGRVGVQALEEVAVCGLVGAGNNTQWGNCV